MTIVDGISANWPNHQMYLAELDGYSTRDGSQNLSQVRRHARRPLQGTVVANIKPSLCLPSAVPEATYIKAAPRLKKPVPNTSHAYLRPPPGLTVNKPEAAKAAPGLETQVPRRSDVKARHGFNNLALHWQLPVAEHLKAMEEEPSLGPDVRSMQEPGLHPYVGSMQCPTGSLVSGHECITTIMIRNIPRFATETFIMHELDKACEGRKYDFLYLPWDSKRSRNMGYGFVNFEDSKSCQVACKKLQGQPWTFANAKRPIEIMSAHWQGLRASLEHICASGSMRQGTAHSPMVFKDGVQVDLQTAVSVLSQVSPKADVDNSTSSFDESVAKKGVRLLFGSTSSDCSDTMTEATTASIGTSSSATSCDSTQSLDPVSVKSDLDIVLTSEEYRTAWASLNNQLNALLVWY